MHIKESFAACNLLLFPCTGLRTAVTAIALDNAGARLLTGGHDYAVKIFDFGGMKSDAKPFRTLEVEEGHPIVAVRRRGAGVTGKEMRLMHDAG